jgi:hypothetical protein
MLPKKLRVIELKRCSLYQAGGAMQREEELSWVPNNETLFLLVSFASHVIKYSTEIMLGDLLEIRFVINIIEVA